MFENLKKKLRLISSPSPTHRQKILENFIKMFENLKIYLYIETLKLIKIS